MLPLHTTRKDRERKNSKYLLATCAIWVKHSPGQGNRLAGTGSLVRNFFEDEKIHLITSKEVISTDAVNSYFLRFKKLNGSDKRRRELNSIGNKVEFISPGLAIVHVDPDKVSFIRKRTSGLLTYRPFAICAEENEGNSELYFHVVKRSGNKSFDIISCTAYEISTETENVDQDRKSLGAPVAITTKHGEAKIVGVITRDNNMQIYRALFSQIDRSRVCSAQGARKEGTLKHSADQYTSVQGTSQTAKTDIEHGNEPNMSDAKAVKHGKKIGHDNDPKQLAQRMVEELNNSDSGINSMEEDGSNDNRSQEKDVPEQRKEQPKKGSGRKKKKNCGESLDTRYQSAEIALKKYAKRNQNMSQKLQQNRKEQEELQKRLNALKENERKLKKEIEKLNNTQKRADSTAMEAEKESEKWHQQIQELQDKSQVQADTAHGNERNMSNAKAVKQEKMKEDPSDPDLGYGSKGEDSLEDSSEDSSEESSEDSSDDDGSQLEEKCYNYGTVGHVRTQSRRRRRRRAKEYKRDSDVGAVHYHFHGTVQNLKISK